MYIMEGNKKMNVNNLLDDINNKIDENSGMEIYALMKKTKTLEIKRLNVADEDRNISNSLMGLRNGFIQAIKDSLIDKCDTEIINLSSADERGKAVFFYDLDKFPEEMEAMENTAAHRNDFFVVGNDKFEDIKGFIVVIGTEDCHVVLYKQQYPISLLKRDRFMLTPIRHESRFKRYDEDILRIDFNYQFMLWENRFYITDIDKMEKICSFHALIKAEAAKSISDIQKINILENPEVLSDELDDITFARKLTRICKDSKVIGFVSNGNIINFTKKHTFFKKNPIKLNADGTKFFLDSKKSKNAFVRLMNDDLLTSELTNNYYEALAKNNW